MSFIKSKSKLLVIVMLFILVFGISSSFASTDVDDSVAVAGDVDNVVSSNGNATVTQQVNAQEDTVLTSDAGGSENLGSSDGSVVSASDESTLGATTGTFKDLSNLIKSTTTGSITLDRDYIYNSATDADFIEGIIINKTISIDGAGKTINGNGQARIFQIIADNILLRDVIFINGYSASGSGGSIIWNGENGYLVSSIFKNSKADTIGAVYWTGNYGTISNCNFKDNSAKTRIGAVAVSVSSLETVISSCTFENNTSINYGALLINGQYGKVENSIFKNNYATENAGALYWSGSQGTIIHSIFENNHAKNDGALLYSASYGTITNCTFDNNYATNNYGAAYFYYTGTVIYDTKFNNNHAGNDGGALGFQTDTGIVQNCLFTNNQASNIGGGLYSTQNNIVRYCTFINNTAKTAGGLYDTHNNFKLENCIFTSNSAINGGGAYTKGGLSNSLFDNNNATYGGGIHISGTGFKIDNITFKKNTATDGGAIYTSTSGYGSIVNSIFEENIAKNNGGAINCMAQYVSIEGCTFTKNTAENIGGAIYANKDYFSVLSSTFNGNIAKNENSGAIYIQSSIKASTDGNTYKTSKDTVNIAGITNMPGVLYISPNGNDDGSSISKPTSLAVALENIANGGTIYVTNGEYTGLTSYTLAKTVKLIGLGSPIFNLQNMAKNFININNFNCYFENLTFINGNSRYNIITGSNGRQFAYIYNCTFKNNGRAISAGGRYWIIDKCTFINNSFNDMGGAFYSTFTGQTILNSKFINNIGTDGGAIYLNGQGYIVENCEFIGNNATNGGAIYFTGYNLNQVTNCIFINNNAVNKGGAIYYPSQDSQVSNSIFINNSASDGGAILFSGIKNTIDDSKFSGNNASNGGAIYSTGNEIHVSNSNFTGNNASSGGAIYSTGSGASISGSNFEKNSATNGSAVMVGENTDITIEGSDFNGNVGNGSVYVPEGSNFVIDSDTTFENNVGGDLETPGVVSALVLYVNVTATGDGLLVTGPTNWEQGFANVLDGGTLYILPGTYDLSQVSPIIISKSLSIVGLGDGVIFTNYARGTIFDVQADNVKLENIRFTSITGDYIKWDGTNGIIDSCIFDGSSTNSNSNLISTSVGSTNFKVSNSNFTGFKYKSLISASNYLTTIDNVVFKSNAPYSTGSYLVDTSGSDLSIVDSEFISNTAKLVNFQTTATRGVISGSTFTGNSVGSGNSLIYINSKSSSVSNSVFKSSNTGGTFKNIYATEDITLSGNTFEGVAVGLNSVSGVTYPNNPSVSGTFNNGVNRAYDIPVTANGVLLSGVGRSGSVATFTYSWSEPVPGSYTLRFGDTDANGNKYIYTSSPSVSATVNRISKIYVSPSGTGNGATSSTPTTWDKVASLLTDNGEVVFTSGTYTDFYGKTINKAWTLTASGKVILDANNKGRIFSITANGVNIEGFTFQNGKVTTGSGGAIYNTGTGVTIKNSIFTGNSAPTANIISSTKAITITNSQLKNPFTITTNSINFGTAENIVITFPSGTAPSKGTIKLNGEEKGTYDVTSNQLQASIPGLAVGSYVVTQTITIIKEVY